MTGTAGATPERLSLLGGLLVLMLASVPRYLIGGHETRLTLLLIALAVVAAVGVVQWRLLEAAARARLPGLLGRLGACLALGLVLMAAWQGLMAGWTGWPLLLSHGATLGLLLHALGLWWKPVGGK